MHHHRSATLAAVALLTLATTAAASPSSCVPSGFNTLRASGAARVYSRASELYACLGTRRTRLGSLRGTGAFPARRVALYALSSRYAATDTIDNGVDTLASTVSLIDLESGATISTAPATTPERAAESFVTASAIAVSATGALAWIGERSAIGALAPVYEVHARLLAGSDRLLESTAVKPDALELHADTISWKTAGRTHTTSL